MCNNTHIVNKQSEAIMDTLSQLKDLRLKKMDERNITTSSERRDQLSREIARHSEQIRRIESDGEYCKGKK